MSGSRAKAGCRCRLRWVLVLGVLAFGITFHLGCHRHRPSVTAVPLSPWNQCEPEGIPYYLPKPLLVVAKNVRHIDESKVGLTPPVPIPNGFDNQASYADLKANVTVPGATATAAAAAGNAAVTTAFDPTRTTLTDISEKMIPKDRIQDGVAPDSFYTYQIVFVPDLSQKYGLRIKGGPGEMRAAMNLVNGWMYTGMGPFYLKDSSTAQNMMAFGVASMYTGRGVADVLGEVGELARVTGGGAPERAGADAEDVLEAYTNLARVLQSQTLVPQEMLNYAQISIYEPQLLPDGTTNWGLIAEHHFDRHYFQPSMSKDAIDLFKEILEADETRRTSQPTQFGGGASRTSTTGGNPPEGREERASADIIEGFTPPADPDHSLNQLERSMLGLPMTTAQDAPVATEVNVHVGTEDRPQGSHWKGFGFLNRERPTIERRVLVYEGQDSISNVGGGTQNPATLQGSSGPGRSIGD